jgi:integrase
VQVALELKFPVLSVVRVNELRQLRVSQIDLAAPTIRLEPGTTKNTEGRTVVMTELVYQLIAQCIVGKKPEERVFTSERG